MAALGHSRFDAEFIARELQGRHPGEGWIKWWPARQDRSPSLRITGLDGKIPVRGHPARFQSDVVGAFGICRLWSDQDRILVDNRLQHCAAARAVRWWAPTNDTALGEFVSDNMGTPQFPRGHNNGITQGGARVAEDSTWRVRLHQLRRAWRAL